MKLFAVYVGGKMPTSNVELHDLRFSAGESIEDCFDDLRRQWWGTSKSLHIDAWGEIEYADGYDVSLRAEPFLGPQKLWFVNLGGYDPGEFTELHKNIWLAAETESQARLKALETIRVWKSPHKDQILDIEQTVCLTRLFADRNIHIHLTATASVRPFRFHCKYYPIARKSA